MATMYGAIYILELCSIFTVTTCLYIPGCQSLNSNQKRQIFCTCFSMFASPVSEKDVVVKLEFDPKFWTAKSELDKDLSFDVFIEDGDEELEEAFNFKCEEQVEKCNYSLTNLTLEKERYYVLVVFMKCRDGCDSCRPVEADIVIPQTKPIETLSPSTSMLPPATSQKSNWVDHFLPIALVIACIFLVTLGILWLRYIRNQRNTNSYRRRQNLLDMESILIIGLQDSEEKTRDFLTRLQEEFSIINEPVYSLDCMTTAAGNIHSWAYNIVRGSTRVVIILSFDMKNIFEMQYGELLEPMQQLVNALLTTLDGKIRDGHKSYINVDFNSNSSEIYNIKNSRFPHIDLKRSFCKTDKIYKTLLKS